MAGLMSVDECGTNRVFTDDDFAEHGSKKKTLTGLSNFAI